MICLYKDLAGVRFGRLVPVRRNGSYRNKARWDCVCDCGKKVNVIGCNLTNGGTKSCGCRNGEVTAWRNVMNAKHGLGGTPTYETWYGILDRCRNPRSHVYHNYGGRGVAVCDFIAADPRNFVTVVGMKPGAKREYSIDRKDNNGHYSCGTCVHCVANQWPMNLRWATPKEQMRNVRYNRMITINGRTQCRAAWAEESGINAATILSRMAAGWPEERWLVPLYQ